MKQKTILGIDLLVLLGIIMIAAFLVIYFQVRFLTSTIFFFVTPSVYLLIRKRTTKSVKNVFIASLLMGIVCSFVFDFLAEFNNAWSWPDLGRLVFPYKVLGIVPVDVMIWYFFYVFLIFLFYEYFIEYNQKDKLSPNFKYGFFVSIILLITLLLIFFTSPNILKFHYAYLIIATIASLPAIFFIIKKPSLLKKFLKVSLFFIFLYLIFEFTSLKLDHWRFSGQYIGAVDFWGLRFPFEELFFWILISNAIALSYYEFFVDDNK